MEKQDILEKSRREKTDEGVTYAENAGRRYGMIAFCLLSLLQSAVMIFCEPNLSDLFPKRKIEKKQHLKSSKTHPHVQYQSCPKGERFLPHQLSFIHTGIQENIKSNLARR